MAVGSDFKLTGIEDFNRIITQAKFGEKVLKEIDEATKEVADEGVKKLQENSMQFGTTGKYAKGWTKKQVGDSYVLYNKDYRLPHLLENPHPIIAHGKVVAHWQGKPHIKPVEEEIIKKMEKRIDTIIDKEISKI